MATQKPISTISYNTEAFLREKLEGWYKAHIIQAYQYIKHKGEDGDKDHIHLRIEPNKKLDQMTLTEELREFVLGKDKPLGVRPWRPSKEEDWLLYAIHDEEYMKLKYPDDRGEKLPYSWEEIQASEGFDMEVAFIRAKASLKHNSSSLMKAMLNGKSSLDLIAEGENVFTVNATMRSLNQTDYERVNRELQRVRNELDKVLSALERSGLGLEADEDGELIVVRYGDHMEL